MFNIAEYLKKFAHIESDSAFQKEIITRALREVCNLENVDFEMKGGTLYIKASPLVKSIVFMKKDHIVEYLKRTFPRGRITDVR